jgi:hypothetical protein
MSFKRLLGIGALLAIAAAASHTILPQAKVNPAPVDVTTKTAAVNPAAATKPVEAFDRATVERLVRHEFGDSSSITFDSMQPRTGIYFNDPYGPKTPVQTVCGRVTAKGRPIGFIAHPGLRYALTDKSGTSAFRKAWHKFCVD